MAVCCTKPVDFLPKPTARLTSDVTAGVALSEEKEMDQEVASGKPRWLNLKMVPPLFSFCVEGAQHSFSCVAFKHFT